MEEQKSNFERMIALVEDVFAMREDPEQLQVNEEVLKELGQIHPSTLTELDEGKGPCIWLLLIPASLQTMELFIEDRITEQGLYDRTKAERNYEAVYLCSASTLPEYRGKGLTKKLCKEAITAMQHNFPVKALFVWPFTGEGASLAKKIAEEMHIPLHIKTSGHH